ncbi:MAG: glycosyltransferase [Nanobdellota archaeon]
MIISIIIPTYNRCDILKETLNSFLYLKNKKFEFEYEIILVDNNSSDDTKSVVLSFSGSLPVLYLHEPRQGKNYAVNQGIEFSRGDILVFVDDDVTVNKNWIVNIYKSIKNYNDVNIFGGKILTHWPEKTPSWVHYSSNTFPFMFCDHNLGEKTRQYSSSPLPGGANFWVRKSLFIKHNAKFNEQYGPSGKRRVAGSETEFLKRMYNKGEKIMYIPDAIVHHRVFHDEFRLLRVLHRFSATGKSSHRYQSANRSRSFIGIPFYLYNQLLSEFFKFAFYLALMNKDKYMNSMIKIAYFYGRSKAFIASK